MEHLQVGRLLADAGEANRAAGRDSQRERGPAPGVTVELGQHHAVDTDRLVEGGSDVDRLLAGHGIGDQQRLGGADRLLEPDQLSHQLLVDLQPPGRVEDDDVGA